MFLDHPPLNLVKQPEISVQLPVTHVQPIVTSTQYLETSDEKTETPVKQPMTSVNQLLTSIPHPMISPESTLKQQPLTEDQPLSTSAKQPVSSAKQPVILVNQSLDSVQYPVTLEVSTEHQQQHQTLATDHQPFSSQLPTYFPQSFYLPVYQMPHSYPTHHNYYWVPDMFPGVAYRSHQLDYINQDHYHVMSTRNGSLED